MVQQGIFLTLFTSRGTADYDYRRFFGESLGRGVRDFQPTHAIGNTNRAEAPNPGVGICSKTSALLIGGVYQPQFTSREQVIKTKHIIAGNSEHMTGAMS